VETLALGRRMHSAGIVLRGKLSDQAWSGLLRTIAEAIGMEPVGDPAKWSYPIEGKGGNGLTIVLPITDSFLALDTWPDYQGAYLFVCSCRPYHTKDIDDVAKKFGLGVELKDDRRFYRELNLA
jgi:hypothetical protein